MVICHNGPTNMFCLNFEVYLFYLLLKSIFIAIPLEKVFILYFTRIYNFLLSITDLLGTLSYPWAWS